MLDTALHRLHNQHIEGVKPDTVAEVVYRLGAIQAQDYLGSLWAVGLRLRQSTEASIEQAIADKRIVRTWPMRGTLHFVTAEDARWMLRLLTPRVIARSAGRYKQLELDVATFARSEDLLAEALQGGRQLTRSEMFAILEGAGISTTGQRGIHILSHLAQNGLLCFGSRRGRQPTFTLLDEWLPPAPILEPNQSLAEITRRYFTGHGPATLHDFVRWTGLLVTEARAGLQAVKSELLQEVVDSQTYWRPLSTPAPETYAKVVHLLPPFDEYLVGYKERAAVLDPENAIRVIPGSNGMFNPVIVSQGQVVGTWKRTLKKAAGIIEAMPFRPFTAAEKEALAEAAYHYGEFLGMQIILA